LTAIQLMRVNTGYAPGQGEIFWPEFFSREDLDESIAALHPGLKE
jgi:hypothetical protein